MPRVSVVIPCFNHGAYVDEAVDSIFDQTFQDWEAIIVNDGSTDAFTNDKLHGYDRPKTTVIHTENRGLPSARNRGIQESEGEYILTLDADDRFDASFLEKAVSILDSSPHVGAVSCGVKFFGGEEHTWLPKGGGAEVFLVENGCCGNSLFRKKCWEEIGGYDEQMVEGFEDWDFWIRMTSRSRRIHIIPEYLFYYRRGPESMLGTIEKRGRRADLTRKLVEKHRKLFETHVAEVVYGKELVIQELRDSISGLLKSKDYRLGRAVLRPCRFAKRGLLTVASILRLGREE